MQRHQRDLWDKFWKDDSGHYVIWQRPNAWLIGWVIFTVLSLFFTRTAADILSGIGSTSLTIWAWFEIWKGDSYFRRLLGVLVLVFSIASLIKSF